MQEQETTQEVMQKMNDTIVNLASAERYDVARPHADKICKMFAIPLLAGESSVMVAISAMLSWYCYVIVGGVLQAEIDTVCAQLVEITAAIRKDCAHKAEDAYKEAQADDGN